MLATFNTSISLNAQTILRDTTLLADIPAGDFILYGDVTFNGVWDISQLTNVTLRGGGSFVVNSLILGEEKKLVIRSDSLFSKPQVFFNGVGRPLAFEAFSVEGFVYHEVNASLVDTFSLVEFCGYSKLEFAHLSIINNRYSKIDDGQLGFNMQGAVAIRNVDTISIDSMFSCNNLAQDIGGGLYIDNVSEFSMLNSRHHNNTAQDTVRISPTEIVLSSLGGGSLRIDRGGTCVVRNAIVTGDTSFFAVGLFCDSVNVSNMHISSSPGTYASYDNESLKPHIYTHVSVTEGLLGAIANHANDYFINSVITGLERPNREIPSYDGPSNRTVTYINTAINYDCGGNCEGTVPLNRGAVPRIPLSDDECPTDEFLGSSLTPNSNSPLVNRVPVVPGFERDLFGNMRGIGGLADLGAIEYVGLVSAKEPSTNFGLTVHPNPATDFIRYKLDGSNETVSGIRLVNTIGSIILDLKVNRNEDVVLLDSDIASGLYFIHFQMSSGKMVSKSIIIN